MASRLDNDRILRALMREPVDRTPVWMMRQAGRYLPEYREVRARAGDFMSLCTSPEYACEVTLQPLDRFPLDAAILFSDILTIPDAMGLGLSFVHGEGPQFENPVRDARSIQRLGVPDPETDLGYVMDAVRLVRSELDGKVPLIGFAGSPWTLATYMVEGGSSRTFSRIKAMRYEDPVALHTLLTVLAESVATYVRAQIEAGAQIIQIFDTWGGVLTPSDYREFSLDYMTHVIEALPEKNDGRPVPVIIFTKGGGPWLEAMVDSGADCLGLDWTVDIGDARARVGNRVALQGNLDPSALLASPEHIREAVADVLGAYGHGTGHVFNLGHGITPDVPPEHAAAMIEAVQALSASYHEND
jgi:uroporphyrinogen decarboxylase